MNSPFSPNRLLAQYDNILKLKAGEIPPPRMAIVYPSYLCNQNCEYCFYTSERNEYGSTMFDHSQFIHVVDTLHKLGVGGIEFCGGGEPTLNPHLADASKHALALGMKLGLLTNGTGIGSKLEEVIMNSYSYIRFSVDSFNRDTYIAKRRPKNESQFDLVMSKMIYFGTKRRPNSKLKVGAKILLTGNSVTAAIKEIDYALGVCGSWNLDSLQIKVAEEAGAPLSAMFKNADVIEKYIDSRRHRYNFAILAGLRKTTIKEQCWLNPMQVTISADGQIFLCCYFQHRKESHSIGNIFKNDLLSIWGSAEHIKKIKSIRIPECSLWNCRFHGHHNYAKEMLDDVFQLQFV